MSANRYKSVVSSKKLKLLLVVLIPAFNEEDMIGLTIKKVRSELNKIKFLECLIYVIDDGSSDSTSYKSKVSGADKVISHKINLGLGAAVRSGLQAAKNINADFVIKFDADLQHDPKDILRIINPLINNQSDIVYGNRFRQIDYSMPFVRRLGNKTFTALMRWLTGWPLKDSQPGIFAVNNSYLECFFIPGDYNYTQQILLDAYHKNLRFSHIDVHFTKRITGKSFITLKYPFQVLPQILMVLMSVRPMRVFFPIGSLFFLAGSLIFLFQIYYWIIGANDRPVNNVNLVTGLVFFGLHTIFFGILAELIVQRTRK